MASKTRLVSNPDDAPATLPVAGRRSANYERLIVAARDVFAKEGGSASMEAIAREAGVGVGTLYRHFPQRIDVVEAVYRDEVDQLVAAADQAIAEFEPWPAVVAFLEAFVRYAQGKRTSSTSCTRPSTSTLISSCVRRSASTMRWTASSGAPKTPAPSVPTSTAPSSCSSSARFASARTLSEEQSHRLLGMILDGLRHPSKG